MTESGTRRFPTLIGTAFDPRRRPRPRLRPGRGRSARASLYRQIQRAPDDVTRPVHLGEPTFEARSLTYLCASLVPR